MIMMEQRIHECFLQTQGAQSRVFKCQNTSQKQTNTHTHTHTHTHVVFSRFLDCTKCIFYPLH